MISLAELVLSERLIQGRDEFYEKIGKYSLIDHNTKKDVYHAVTWISDARGMV